MRVQSQHHLIPQFDQLLFSLYATTFPTLRHHIYNLQNKKNHYQHFSQRIYIQDRNSQKIHNLLTLELGRRKELNKFIKLQTLILSCILNQNSRPKYSKKPQTTHTRAQYVCIPNKAKTHYFAQIRSTDTIRHVSVQTYMHNKAEKETETYQRDGQKPIVRQLPP